ncbi:MAG: hypothetical protein UV64_C0037G0005 [Parcubacteria group bacterium GW2011_GWC1_43_11b]|nr:MAG: hypothetical protein UV64_C0037G0005 [Parcubacteria group bacterium GW2011_GWC1_43_11b]
MVETEAIDRCLTWFVVTAARTARFLSDLQAINPSTAASVSKKWVEGATVEGLKAPAPIKTRPSLMP